MPHRLVNRIPTWQKETAMPMHGLGSLSLCERSLLDRVWLSDLGRRIPSDDVAFGKIMTKKNAILVERLLENAIEMHSKEMSDYHGNDAEHRGLAPDACGYCKTFEDVANLLGLDLKESIEVLTG
jgi:hypothetical protein